MERGLHCRVARLEATRSGRGALHVLLHPQLAGADLERWRIKAMAGLPLAATVIVVPRREKVQL